MHKVAKSHHNVTTKRTSLKDAQIAKSQYNEDFLFFNLRGKALIDDGEQDQPKSAWGQGRRNHYRYEYRYLMQYCKMSV